MQTLAGKAGLQSTPTEPIGAAMVGGNPDQQKMAGTPQQLQASFTKSLDAGQSLADIQRRKQVRDQASQQEQAKQQQAQNLQGLGGLGDRVTQLIDAQKQKLTTAQPVQVGAAEGIVNAQTKQPLDPGTLGTLKTTLGQLQKDPTNVQLMAQVNQLLGYDANTQLSPDQVGQLYGNSVDAIAKSGADTIDNKLTASDLTALPNFGYDINSLAGLLQVDPAELSNYSLGQIRDRISALTQAGFQGTQQLEQKATDPNLGAAERGLARDLAQESSRTGLRSTEQDVAHLNQQIQNADQVQFNGKTFAVDDLLNDATISQTISDYLHSPEGSDIRKQLDQNEPALSQFINKNYALFNDAVATMNQTQQKVVDVQKYNKGLLDVGDGLSLDPAIAQSIYAGFGKDLTANTIDETKVPLFNVLKHGNPELAKNLVNQLNTIQATNPEALKDIASLSESELTRLAEGGAQKFQDLNKQKQELEALPDGDVNTILSKFFGRDTDAATVQNYLSENKARNTLGFGKGDQINALDMNQDGKLDSPADIKQKMLNGLQHTSLKDILSDNAHAFQAKTDQKLQQPSLNNYESEIMQALGSSAADGKISGDDVRGSLDRLSLEDLFYLQNRPTGGNLDADARGTIAKAVQDRVNSQTNKIVDYAVNLSNQGGGTAQAPRSIQEAINYLKGTIASADKNKGSEGNAYLNADPMRKLLAELEKKNETLAFQTKYGIPRS